MSHPTDLSVAAFPSANTRAGTALRSLMQMWEQDLDADEHESESELMVMLSGMVGAHATDPGEE
jgi:hypothetical protein